MKDAVTNANNAFESTLKTICKQRKWQYPQGATASNLLNIVRENGLLPNYLDNSFDQLVATLKSGLPKVEKTSREGTDKDRPRARRQNTSQPTHSIWPPLKSCFSARRTLTRDQPDKTYCV